ncbi:hypothetical protein BHE74_00044984 [Ensete ventricosum]|nr:hypothetical protein GW17_00033510 [Ensete ventricosum]RWW48907.1 hypothetical protein BHE74_00044984 [Ensete ventricosum]
MRATIATTMAAAAGRRSRLGYGSDRQGNGCNLAPSSGPRRRCKRRVSANGDGVPSRGRGWKDLIGLDGATRAEYAIVGQ